MKKKSQDIGRESSRSFKTHSSLVGETNLLEHHRQRRKKSLLQEQVESTIFHPPCAAFAWFFLQGASAFQQHGLRASDGLCVEESSDVDAFFVYTDNETWAGHIKPVEALRQYRNERNPQAKLVVCGMTGTPFTIADPNDAGMLDVVGFSSDAPAVMSNFISKPLRNK